MKRLIPDFDLRPFTTVPEVGVARVPFDAAGGESANPFLRVVTRRPLAGEAPMPVGIVSRSYRLVQHLDIARLCRDGICSAENLSPHELRYEIGLSELDELMHLRIRFPECYGMHDFQDKPLGLRLECFNAVDGRASLVIILGWLRFVCANGLVIGKAKVNIRHRHSRGLDLTRIRPAIRDALRSVESDRDRIRRWQGEEVEVRDVSAWADEAVTKAWRTKAAARVFHICDSGHDVEIERFTGDPATRIPVRRLVRVPGSPGRARTRYDVSQALSYVATRRRDIEERLEWQEAIPGLLEKLPSP
ncbi:DUF932 domain-containing protein [Candidatus Palauibacter sp.]|uniref:DUF932 domain-containing protein n=1 Tax=Candidatus Palauibacter sp. TaxID=3101350 RepID=UPI003B01D16A